MSVDSSEILLPQPEQTVTLLYRSKNYTVTVSHQGMNRAATTPKEMGKKPAHAASTPLTLHLGTRQPQVAHSRGDFHHCIQVSKRITHLHFFVF